MQRNRNQVKEDEIIERTIRGLLKLPENRRCINCNSLGPQYVCTTFMTFICTNCSGVHREFTHRVKSVSMAKFTPEEVSALQAAGNERARQVYLKEWDARYNSYPDSSNLNGVRNFIKHVYVDRMYTGESIEKLSKLRTGEKLEPYESRKVGAYLDTRSPRYESRYQQSSSARAPYESRRRYEHSSSARYESRYDKSSSARSYHDGRNDDRNSRYYSDEIRSPQYTQENSRHGSYRKSSARFEIVDDRFRDDGPGSGRRCSYRNREYQSGNRSSAQQTDPRSSSGSLVVRPIKDILGENAPTLEVGKHPSVINQKDTVGSANNQKFSRSGSLPVDVNRVEHIKGFSESLINLSSDPEPPDAAAPSPSPSQALEVGPSNDGGNQSLPEPSAKEKAPVAPNPNTLEFLLFELSTPSFTPVCNMSEDSVLQRSDSAPSIASGSNMPAGSDMASMQMSTLPSSVGAPTTASTSNMPEQLSGANMPAGGAVPSLQMSTLPSSIRASTTALTSNMPVQLSGANMPADGASPAAPFGQMSTLPSSFGASTTTSTTNVPVEQSGGNMPVSDVSPAPPLGEMTTLPNDPATVSISADSAAKVPDAQQLNSMQQHQPMRSSAVNISSSSAQQNSAPDGFLNNQPWTSSLVPNTQGLSSTSAEKSSQTVSKSPQDTSSGVSKPLRPETKSTERKELPEDLFANYMPASAPVPHWQTGHSHAMGFNMQYYPNAMQGPAYSNPAKSANPFDFNSETGPMQAPPFSSMASLQGALPNANLSRTSSVGAHSQGLMAPHSSSYASQMLPRSSSFSSAMPSGAFLEQQVHNTNMTHSRSQEGHSFGNDRAAFGLANSQQQPTGGYSAPTNTNSFSSTGGGNPFG